MFFEDRTKEFLVYLNTDYPGDVEADGVVDWLRVTVCNNLLLYMGQIEGEFRPYLSCYISAVLTAMTRAALSPSLFCSPLEDG